MKKIYLDYAASTPVGREVLQAMVPYFSGKFGNPGALHSFGQEAMAAVDRSREIVAKAVSTDFRGVIFTGSATEANNLALRGVVAAARHILRGTGRLFSPAEKIGIGSRRARSSDDRAGRTSETFRSEHVAPFNRDSWLKPKIVVSAIEHESVLETAHDLAEDGVELVLVPVNKEGMVDLEKLEAELDERTILVSVMYVNNEIGSIQPISEISEIVRNFRNVKSRISNDPSAINGSMPKHSRSFGVAEAAYPLLHTDAAQALMYFDCAMEKLGVDLMTISGQKVCGPKGIGALCVRRGERNNGGETFPRNSSILDPLVTGGGQEFGLRSGTENVPLIAGFAEAVERAEKNRRQERGKVAALKKYFWKQLKNIAPETRINGCRDAVAGGAPHILNVSFPAEYAGDMLIRFDRVGIAASAGSACSARAFTPSHVLSAMGFPEERVRGSVRFSFGLQTTRKEVDEAIRRIGKII